MVQLGKETNIRNKLVIRYYRKELHTQRYRIQSLPKIVAAQIELTLIIEATVTFNVNALSWTGQSNNVDIVQIWLPHLSLSMLCLNELDIALLLETTTTSIPQVVFDFNFMTIIS